MAKLKDPTSVTHMDMLGKPIAMDSLVAAVYFQTAMSICKVTSIAEKTIRLTRVGHKKSKSFSRYPNEVLVLDPEDLTMYFLRKLK